MSSASGPSQPPPIRRYLPWRLVLAFVSAVSVGTVGGIALADQAQQGMPLPYPLPSA